MGRRAAAARSLRQGPGTPSLPTAWRSSSGFGVEEKATEFAKFITSPGPQGEYELQGGAGLTPLRPSAQVDEFVKKEPSGSRSSTASPMVARSRCSRTTRASRISRSEMVQSVVTGKAEPWPTPRQALPSISRRSCKLLGSRGATPAILLLSSMRCVAVSGDRFLGQLLLNKVW